MLQVPEDRHHPAQSQGIARQKHKPMLKTGAAKIYGAITDRTNTQSRLNIGVAWA